MTCRDYDEQPEPSDWPPPVEEGWWCECGLWHPFDEDGCDWCGDGYSDEDEDDYGDAQPEDYVDDGDFIF